MCSAWLSQHGSASLPRASPCKEECRDSAAALSTWKLVQLRETWERFCPTSHWLWGLISKYESPGRVRWRELWAWVQKTDNFLIYKACLLKNHTNICPSSTPMHHAQSQVLSMHWSCSCPPTPSRISLFASEKLRCRKVKDEVLLRPFSCEWGAKAVFELQGEMSLKCRTMDLD